MSRFYTGLLCLFMTLPAFALNKEFHFSQRENNTWVVINVNPVSSKLADVLFVIDNSGSMQEHQNNLIKNLDVITQQFSNYQGLNAAVLSTTTANFFSGSTFTAGQFINGVHHSTDSNFMQNLTAALKVGTNGDATEMPFDSIGLAFSEPLISTVNKDFLRPNADLFVVFLTDTQDQSKTFTEQTLFDLLKQHVPNNSITSIAGMVTDTKTCPGETSELMSLPTKIQNFVTLTGGSVFSLCGDFTKNLTDAIQASVIFDSEVILPEIKGKSIVFNSIQVTVGGKALPAGDIHAGWIVDIKNNKLILGDDVVKNAPKSGPIQVAFQVK